MNNKSYYKRFTRVLWVFFKIFLAFRKEMILVKKKGYKKAQLLMKHIHTKRAKELYSLAIDSGGVMIKLCQYFSTRRDMFPEPYIQMLTPLQDNVPPVSFELIRKRLAEEYGDYNKYFKSIEETPLAAASLGQVHRASLLTGEDVVIKVLKPESENIVDIDFAILFHVFTFFSKFKALSGKVDILQILNEFIRVTGDELNFKREASVSKELKEKLSRLSYLKIPHVYEELSTRSVLVMEYCTGVKITEIEDYKAYQCDPNELARRIINIYIEQLLFIKLIHFDPHPGNILVNPGNQIVLLDFGMSGEITPLMSNGIKNGLKAFINKDYRGILDVLNQLGFFRKGINRYNLLPVLEYFFDEIIDTVQLDKESMQSVDLTPVIDDLIDIMYTQPLVLPVEWAYIGRTVSTLGGIVATLNPNFKMYEEFKPFADRLLKQNMDEIISTVFSTVKKNAQSIFALPSRLEYLLDSHDRGNLKFKVDLTEVDNRLDNLNHTIIRLVGIGIGFFSYIGAYTIYKVGDTQSYLLLFGVGTFSFLFSWVYSFKFRIQKKREMIKKSLTR